MNPIVAVCTQPQCRNNISTPIGTPITINSQHFLVQANKQMGSRYCSNIHPLTVAFLWPKMPDFVRVIGALSTFAIVSDCLDILLALVE